MSCDYHLVRALNQAPLLQELRVTSAPGHGQSKGDRNSCELSEEHDSQDLREREREGGGEEEREGRIRYGLMSTK